MVYALISAAVVACAVWFIRRPIQVHKVSKVSVIISLLVCLLSVASRYAGTLNVLWGIYGATCALLVHAAFLVKASIFDEERELIPIVSSVAVFLACLVTSGSLLAILF